MLQTKFISLLVVLTFIKILDAQKRVLFIGNSYTASNNLPNMIYQCAESTGDQLIYDSNLIGGATFEMHAQNITTLNKIAQGNWDFVVLQEQSQRPAFPEWQVQEEVFPFAKELDSLINVSDSCAETMFYMTWGRKNGDESNCPFWPPICTYEGMDSLLHLRYMQMAEENSAVVSPVGAVWKYLRANNPEIELYSADNSHPSVLGSYAAACSFYTTIFRKDPTQILWNSSLNQNDANTIKAAAKAVIFDSLSNWNIGVFDPVASFSIDLSQYPVINCINTSSNSDSFSWYINDSLVSTNIDFSFEFNGQNENTITLVAEKCDDSSMYSESLGALMTNSVQENLELISYPNPFTRNIIIEGALNQEIKLYNLLGKEVFAIQVENNKISINLEFIDPGVYYLVSGNRMIKVTKCNQ